MGASLTTITPQLNFRHGRRDMLSRNIRQGYDHWCLTAMYPVGIYLIGTQRAAPCPTSPQRQRVSWHADRGHAEARQARRRLDGAVGKRQRSPYEVSPDPDEPHCTCPDHETNGVKCKHIFAVEYAMRRECSRRSRSPASPMSVEPPVKKTYPQNWRAYNAAQTHEKQNFQQLLHELVSQHKEADWRSTKGGHAFRLRMRSSAPASKCTRPCQAAVS